MVSVSGGSFRVVLLLLRNGSTTGRGWLLIAMDERWPAVVPGKKPVERQREVVSARGRPAAQAPRLAAPRRRVPGRRASQRTIVPDGLLVELLHVRQVDDILGVKHLHNPVLPLGNEIEVPPRADVTPSRRLTTVSLLHCERLAVFIPSPNRPKSCSDRVWCGPMPPWRIASRRAAAFMPAPSSITAT